LEVHAERVLVGARAALAADRPAVDLVAAGDRAVGAGGGQDLGVGRREGHAIDGKLRIETGHDRLPQAWPGLAL